MPRGAKSIKVEDRWPAPVYAEYISETRANMTRPNEDNDPIPKREVTVTEGMQGKHLSAMKHGGSATWHPYMESLRHEEGGIDAGCDLLVRTGTNHI